MKKFYYLLFASCLLLAACKTPEDPVTPPEPQPEDTTEVVPTKTEWEIADSLYTVADYTVPSHTALKMAIVACAADSSQANLELLRQRISELQPKEEPYNMVATFNGDPKTNMGFCWFTNDGITDGEVQIVPIENATEADFANAASYPATPTQTKGLRYTGKARWIVNASGIGAGVRYKYISHKALATDLTPDEVLFQS